MTSKLAVVKAYIDLNGVGGGIEAATAYFLDDFQNFDKNGKVVMTKDGIIGMARMMNASFKSRRSRREHYRFGQRVSKLGTLPR